MLNLKLGGRAALAALLLASGAIAMPPFGDWHSPASSTRFRAATQC